MMYMEPTKQCRDCRALVPLSDFYKASTRDGRASYCKPCHRVRNRAAEERWQERNPRPPRVALTDEERKERQRAKDKRKYERRVARMTAEERRQYLVWRKYKITAERYNAMLEQQGGGCAVCGVEEDPLCVDHDHRCCPGRSSCGHCVRALLCSNCNSAEGLLRSDAARARSLAEYMERWSA